MNPSQQYVSNVLTHFVGRSFHGNPDAEEQQYSLLRRIIESGILKAGRNDPNGVLAMAIRDDLAMNRPLSSNEVYYPYCVCFCDIPKESFEIHMRKYSRFGLSFPKPFLIKQGVHPVFYVPNNTELRLPNSLHEFLGRPANLGAAFDNFWSAYRRLQDLTWSRIGMADEARKLLDMIAMFLDFNVLPYLKFFNDSLPESDEENYYMEREWRVLGPVRFRLEDIDRVILPNAFLHRFHQDFPSYNVEFFCPDFGTS